jgi:hypothetical protein
MALGDFRVKDSSTGLSVAHTYAVDAGTVGSIKAGEIVVKDSEQGYVELAADGAANADVYIGVAASDSTETATADGTVEVYDNPMCVFTGKPTTAGNLARALVFTQVTLDVAGGTNGAQTIDENDTSNGTFIITDFNDDEDTIDFRFATNDHITAG